MAELRERKLRVVPGPRHLTPRDEKRAWEYRAKPKPKRICYGHDCDTILSKFNSGKLCGPCRVSMRDLEQSIAEHPSRPKAKVCRWCKATFIPNNHRRRVCFSCIPDVEPTLTPVSRGVSKHRGS